MRLSPPSSAPPSVPSLSRARRRVVSIGLTPLIDVVFILLVFFMLASNLTPWRAIDLQTGASGTGSPSLAGSLLVEVGPSFYRLNGARVSADDLAARLSALLERNPDATVLLRPRGDIDLQTVVNALDRLKNAGIARVDLLPGVSQ